MAYESLYRRYRPRRFSEVRGQDDVVRALTNAVREDRVGHAYLLSGPRGTGKTSTARILAKALNCTNLADGEPCGECASCIAIDAGTSYDLQELDAASNNGVDAMRELIGKAALGSPGRTKVYLLDEVHMLSTGASNALLKTLEEPPGHVVFVLATTDPHKVLPTIRSRTQHFELHLLPATDLEALVREVVADAELEVGEDAIAYALSAGGGSARDTLSALDQVVAAGGVLDRGDQVDELVDAVAAGDTGAALRAVADAVRRGHDPRVVGESLLARLRDVFLSRMGDPLSHVPDDARAKVTSWAELFSDRACTRALEAVGEALRDMRQAPDARIPLEVALVRITRPEADVSLDALAARIERLEAGSVGAGAGARSAATTSVAPAERTAAPDATGEAPAGAKPVATTPARPAGGGSPLDAARALLAGRSGAAPAPATLPAPPSAPSGPPPMPNAAPAVAAAPTADPGASEPSATQAATAAATEPAPTPPPAGPSADATPPSSAPAPGASEAPTVPAAEVAPPTPPPASPPTASPSPSPAPAAPTASPSPSAAPTAATSPAPAPGASTGLPSRDELTSAWASAILPKLSGLTKAMYTVGHFTDCSGRVAVFAVPNAVHRDKSEQKRPEVEAALAAHFGRPVPLKLVVDDGTSEAPGEGGAGADRGASSPNASPSSATTSTSSPGQAPADDSDTIEEIGDIAELADAPPESRTAVDRLKEAFPGAEVVDQ